MTTALYRLAPAVAAVFVPGFGHFAARPEDGLFALPDDGELHAALRAHGLAVEAAPEPAPAPARRGRRKGEEPATPTEE